MKTAEDILNEKNRDIISVSPDITVLEALQVMVKNNIGAVLVKDNSRFTGIYTEREFLHNSAKSGFDRERVKISEVMAEDLICARHDDTVPELQDLLLGKCLRHILIEKNDEVIGIISAGDVTRADLVDHESQLKSVSWDYYENWKWKKK
ncbi:CBS domain-containing protein [bacterium]|nr:CBS domain-containing protein [bacterium]